MPSGCWARRPSGSRSPPTARGRACRELERGEPRHLLYVGDAEPRKGLDVLLAAHAALEIEPPPLVLAGAAAAAAGAPGVTGEPAPSSARLAELHASAIALVHPAIHEGFGLTLLEAMKAGTPVVAVRNAAVEEVCGDAVLYTDQRELHAAIARVSTDAELRSRLADAGRARAAEFSWARSAELHEQAVRLGGV